MACARVDAAASLVFQFQCAPPFLPAPCWSSQRSIQRLFAVSVKDSRQCTISHAPHGFHARRLPRALLAPVFTQSPALPTPESSLGFKPGDDYKLATYDQAIDYFRKLDAASDRLTLVESGRTSYGQPWYFALHLQPGEPGQRREVPADRPASRPSRGPDRRGGAPARAGRARRSCTSTAGCTRPRSRAASTRCSSPTICSPHADDPKIKPILDNVDPDALAVDQSRRPEHRRRSGTWGTSARRSRPRR